MTEHDERTQNPSIADPASAPARGYPTEAPPEQAVAEAGLPPTPPVDLRRSYRVGLVGGLAAAFIAAVGMIQAFDSTRLLIVGTLTFGMVVLHLIPFTAGYVAGRPPPHLEGFAPPRPGARNVLAGLIGGVGTALGLGIFTVVFDSFDLRGVFTNVSPDLLELLKYNQSLGTGLLLILVVGAGVGTLGGAFHLMPHRLRRASFGALGWIVVIGLFRPFVSEILKGLSELTGDSGWPLSVRDWIFDGNGLSVAAAMLAGVGIFAAYSFLGRREGREVSPVRERFEAMPTSRRRNWTTGLLIAALLFMVILPRLLGPFLSEVLDIAALFTVTALGLNIVVGYAGLLDLGYVAFFIVGAYTTAVITSPLSPALTPEWSFWASIPFVVGAAALAGLLVGTPVLRMRGDYLAIVTLGFGEIARIVALSEAASGFTGGAQGIRQIPNINIFGFEIVGPEAFFYVVLGAFLIAAYVSWALQNSRIGRAWMAMREDEPVAEVMGVNVVTAKLTAFVMGAILGSLGGALFASKLGIVFPQRLDIVLSIVFLVIVIVGGMGSVPGVIAGGLLLVSVPEFLREFEAYRFLLYGAILIFMMLKRPEGLIPSKRRVRELHEEELSQDAWLRREAEREEAEAAAEAAATEGS